MPALATGYGPLSIEDFARAARRAIAEHAASPWELRVVLRHERDVERVRRELRGV